ncbi:MAG: DUF3592 domain-containing protein [Anaerolineae bacterium]
MNFGNLFGGLTSSISLIVILPFVFIALAFLYFGLRGRAKANLARRTWQTTQGQVQFSQVEARRSRSGRSGYSTSYYPRVVYEYVVNGNRFQGSRVVLGNEVGLGNYNAVERKVNERYPTGATVQVYYNPNEPREAALEMNAPANNIYIIVAAVILVILIFTSVITFGAQGLAGNFVNQMLNAVPGLATNAPANTQPTSVSTPSSTGK